MSNTRSFATAILAVMTMLGAGLAAGQNYPNKPIRIMASEAGGSTDSMARQIAQALSGSLGQPVIVENRGGATLSIDLVSKATPDGYTLLVSGSTVWTLPLLQSKPLWDPVKDFTPISIGTISPNIVCVAAASPLKSIRELIAQAKARPGALNYSASGPGSSTHLSAELFKYMAGVNIVGINYKSNAPAVNAVAVGEAQLHIGGTSAAVAVNAGRLRVLAVGSLQPSALWPGVPTVSESGVPGYSAQSSTNVFAPGKTPAAIVTRLNQEVVRFLNRPEIKERLMAGGQEVLPGTPAGFSAYIKSDMAAMDKMIKATGIKIE